MRELCHCYWWNQCAAITDFFFHWRKINLHATPALHTLRAKPATLTRKLSFVSTAFNYITFPLKAKWFPVWHRGVTFRSGVTQGCQIKNCTSGNTATQYIIPCQWDVSATSVRVTEKADIHKSLNPPNEISQGRQKGRGRWGSFHSSRIGCSLYCFAQHTWNWRDM